MPAIKAREKREREWERVKKLQKESDKIINNIYVV